MGKKNKNKESLLNHTFSRNVLLQAKAKAAQPEPTVAESEGLTVQGAATDLLEMDRPKKEGGVPAKDILETGGSDAMGAYLGHSPHRMMATHRLITCR